MASIPLSNVEEGKTVPPAHHEDHAGEPEKPFVDAHGRHHDAALDILGSEGRVEMTDENVRYSLLVSRS